MFKKPYITGFHVHVSSVPAYICKWDKLQPWLLQLVLQQENAKCPGLGVCRKRALAIYRVKAREPVQFRQQLTQMVSDSL